jgi:mono/diheme cytochrome c family protein
MYVTGEREPVDASKSVLERAKWVRSPDQGAEVFRLQCSQCHTTDGYLGIRPLVRGRSSASMEGMMARVHQWRGRRMPPFTGNEEDRYAVSVHLAKLGGGEITPRRASASGGAIFDSNCAMCHGSEGEFPIAPLVSGRNEEDLYEAIGRLPDLNPMMPPFEGNDAERRALAQHLVTRR